MPTDFSVGIYKSIMGAKTVNNENYSIITFPGDSSSIDNIVYSSNTWKFTLPQTLKNNDSDHYMLYADGTYINIKK